MTARRMLVLVATSLLASGALLAAPPAQAAITAYSIDVKVDVVRAGAAVPVSVSGLYQAKRCTLSVVGAGKSAPVTATVRNYAVTAKLTAPAGPPGPYRVRAACGKDGTATSDTFQVVAKSSPLKASCDVVESGFSPLTTYADHATVGAVVRNSSPDLAATSVELSVSFRNAGGAVVATTTLRPADIPPGGTVVAGTTGVSAPGAASISVAAVCATATSAVVTPIAGTGTTRQDRGDLYVGGQFPNTTGAVVDRYSSVAYVVRNAGGQIVGGGSTSLDAFIPAGGTGTWYDYLFFFDPGPATVQSILIPRAG